MSNWDLEEAGGDYVERVRGLAPTLEACADQIERERRLGIEPDTTFL